MVDHYRTPDICYGCESLAKRVHNAEDQVRDLGERLLREQRIADSLRDALDDCRRFLSDPRHGYYTYDADLKQERGFLADYAERVLKEAMK